MSFFIRLKEDFKLFVNLLIVSILVILNNADQVDANDNEHVYSSEESTNQSMSIAHPNNIPEMNTHTNTFVTNMNHPVGLRGALWKDLDMIDDQIKDNTQNLQLKLCHNRCSDENCVIFQTPIQTCFNGRTLFPHDMDHSWGPYDIYDELIHHPYNQRIAYFHRYFFLTRDSSCAQDRTKKNISIDLSKAADVYKLPLEICVGPFGKPRPWGEFELINVDDFKLHSKENESFFGSE